MYGKLTFSPDGYLFDNKIGALRLIEFKCPHTRQIVRGSVPEHYLGQIQTGLHLSELNKAVYVDSCFRICSRIELKTGMNHNSCFNRGKLPASLKRDTRFAWGFVFCLQNIPVTSTQTDYLILEPKVLVLKDSLR